MRISNLDPITPDLLSILGDFDAFHDQSVDGTSRNVLGPFYDALCTKDVGTDFWMAKFLEQGQVVT